MDNEDVSKEAKDNITEYTNKIKEHTDFSDSYPDSYYLSSENEFKTDRYIIKYKNDNKNTFRKSLGTGVKEIKNFKSQMKENFDILLLNNSTFPPRIGS